MRTPSGVSRRQSIDETQRLRVGRGSIRTWRRRRTKDAGTREAITGAAEVPPPTTISSEDSELDEIGFLRQGALVRYCRAMNQFQLPKAQMKPKSSDFPSRQPSESKIKSQLPAYVVPIQPERGWALVVAVAESSSSPYTASFWSTGSVGGEIMVSTPKTVGYFDHLYPGEWFRVTYVPFPHKPGDPLHIPNVKHEVIKFDKPEERRKELPLVLGLSPLIQVETTILFKFRPVQMVEFNSERYRLVICPELGSAYAAIPRRSRTESWIDTMKSRLKKDQRNKDIEVTAKLAFPRSAVLNNEKCEIFWFVYNMTYEDRVFSFGTPKDYFEGKDWPEVTDDHKFMSLDEISYEVESHIEEAVDNEGYESCYEEGLDEEEEHPPPDEQQCQKPNTRHLSECGSLQDLEEFVKSCQPHLKNLTVDFDNKDAVINRVKVTALSIDDDTAICFSPKYGWCVAKRDLAGYALRSDEFARMFQYGKWVSLNLYSSRAPDGYYRVANWIGCPGYESCDPPFNLFCSNEASEALILEALAFEHIIQRASNDKGLRYILLETPMGSVWMPGSIEEPGLTLESLTVTCPSRCLCERNYKNYASPREAVIEDEASWGPRHNHYDSDDTIAGFMKEERSQSRLQQLRESCAQGFVRSRVKSAVHPRMEPRAPQGGWEAKPASAYGASRVVQNTPRTTTDERSPPERVRSSCQQYNGSDSTQERRTERSQLPRQESHVANRGFGGRAQFGEYHERSSNDMTSSSGVHTSRHLRECFSQNRRTQSINGQQSNDRFQQCFARQPRARSRSMGRGNCFQPREMKEEARRQMTRSYESSQTSSNKAADGISVASEYRHEQDRSEEQTSHEAPLIDLSDSPVPTEWPEPPAASTRSSSRGSGGDALEEVPAADASPHQSRNNSDSDEEYVISDDEEFENQPSKAADVSMFARS
ncbi:hypothetical protein QR680_006413 [Steinernema hermaphroditum]|uniref:Uncharacterized protein n=1 Tax=Steinernema hermaphroditum TaxID=289476 RepID=A0AA39HVC8_9BILA|nr:hypothetical protein QR680_006413 [Steinernema hermaphroditum]